METFDRRDVATDLATFVSTLGGRPAPITGPPAGHAGAGERDVLRDLGSHPA